ncbi:MAG TPA: SGNH/GDSL hydrolase family protein, partial [Caulobacteraceae bacterium]|nr:SGNH/GDSL hydrolase family protein [Caulobacteraceae bacterium]
VVPPELAERNLDLGAYPAETQFSNAFFEADCDAFVLSLQPSVKMSLWRHRRDGWMFMPENRSLWSAADKAWLHENFDDLGPLGVEQAMRDLRELVARRRETSAAPFLIYDLCTALPGERLHVHTGMEDILSTRLRRFNLGLVELSQATGISVIDVDAILSREGADRLRYDAMHLNAAGCRLVAQEVADVLEDLGLFDRGSAE